jgi:hypothetical protein
MKLDQFAVAVLMFSAIIVMGLMVVDDVNDNYADQGVSINTDSFSNLTDSSEELYNFSNDIYDKIGRSETDAGSLLQAAYSGVRLTFIPFKVAGNYINAVATQLSIPDEVVAFLIGGMAILFTFALVYLIFRFIPFT